MKKSLSLLLFICVSASYSQTKIVSTNLELKKSTYYHQLLSTVHSSTNEFYVLASDRDNTTLIKYNSALFFSDSLQIKTDKNYPKIVGNSFNHKKDIVYYWTSEDFKKFKAVTYDFTEGKTTSVTFDVPLINENIIATFTKNDQLYFLTYLKTDKQIKLYTFRGNRYDEKILDFSPFKFSKSVANSNFLPQYIGGNPIEVVDEDFFNPLYSAANKTKLYPLKDKLLFTLDYSSAETQVFEMDWNTFAIIEKIYPQPKMASGVGSSNSFYYQEKLYQFKVNETQLVLTIHDYQGKEQVIEYKAMAADKITFKNSPLYVQNGNYEAQNIKNTEKFLNRLKNKSIGITVYRTQDDLLITVGGTNETVTSDGLVVGALLTIGGIMLGGDGTIPVVTYDEILQNVYFECRFDNEFKPKELPFSPLAVDFISGFLQQNNLITLHNTTKYKDYFILSYYDSKAKQLVLEKFEDGYPF